MKKIYLVKDIQASDKLAHESGILEKNLMLKAAKGIFSSFKWYGKILIVIGKGNNGGDGFALATLLKKGGFDVETCSIDKSFSVTSELYCKECEELGIHHFYIDGELNTQNYDIIVDCLFGIGFKGHVKKEYIPLIEAINRSGKYIISIDANSGMDLNNGLCDIAVKSSLTISISGLKPGYFLNAGKDYTGEIKEVDIGLTPQGNPFMLLEKEDVKTIFPKRKNLSNKGDYGYVGILGGSKLYPGAIKLANMGQNAIYAGCGVSKIIVPDVIADKIYPYVLESTVVPMPTENGFIAYDEKAVDNALKGLSAVSIGMGWGESFDNQKILKYILETKSLNVVIDADGLNTLSKLGLDILKRSACKIVLTPHLKEFSRLTGKDVKEIMPNLLECATDFVKEYPVTLLLKGPTTIVLDKNKAYFINRGTPGMATAGSGDVLSGILAGMLGYLKEDITYVSANAAYINGYAGELASKNWGDIGMTSGDTARSVSLAIKEITK